MLQQNGFPIDKISLTPPPPPPSDKKQEFSNSVCIPYVGSASHQIKRILASSNIKSIIYCPSQKIYQLLYSHKDKTDNNLKPGVYRIPCTCGKVYIGETGRNLKLKQKEHNYDCRTKCHEVDKSDLVKHAWELDHPIKWNHSELLVPVRNYFSRQIRWSIKIFKNQTIPQNGKPLHATWT